MITMDLIVLVFFLSVAAVILVALCIIDLRTYQLPDSLNLTFGILGLAFHLLSLYGFLSLESALAGALLSGSLFLGLRRLFWKLRHVEALGLGDVKFIAAASMWVGLEGIFWVIVIATISTSCVVAIIPRQGATTSKRPMLTLRAPFGPGLSLGTAIVFTHMLIQKP